MSDAETTISSTTPSGSAAHDALPDLRARIGKSVLARHHQQSMLIGLLANAKLLIESLPGLAKTRAVKTPAKNLAADQSRVQFTPSRRSFVVLLAIALSAMAGRDALAQSDPLPSWNDGAAKKAITDFVARVTAQGSADFVPPAERIATFDNDGTLWCEQPYYFQLAFALDQVKAMAPKHPEWRTQQPFKGLLEKDKQALAAAGEKGLLQIMAATHAGMTTDAFSRSVRDWMAGARHPRFNRPYNSLVYQPMLELLAYLRANGFKTFIVSGGGIEFMRPWVETTYGIPPEQVVGSSGVVKFEIGSDGKPELMKLAKIEFIDDGPGKPAGINRFIGRRPIIAFGNSDGDLQMLQWTTAGSGARFAGIVHHTDAEREYAYDRQSKIGKLDKALDAASSGGWTVVDMKRDWKSVFPEGQGR